MKIGIISDTHDHLENLEKAVQRLKQAKIDLLYHCGDWCAPFTFKYLAEDFDPGVPIKGVLGNNEGERFLIAKRIVEKNWPIELQPYLLEDSIDNLKIAVYHGQEQRLTDALINSRKYDLVLTGHTHFPEIKKRQHTLHINPGTTGDATFGKTEPSLAVFDTKSKKTEIVNFLNH